MNITESALSREDYSAWFMEKTGCVPKGVMPSVVADKKAIDEALRKFRERKHVIDEYYKELYARRIE